MSEVIPDELKKKSYALIHVGQKGRSFRILHERVDSKPSFISIACIPQAFTMLKGLVAVCKMYIACWFVYAGLLALGFLYSRWILLGLFIVFIAQLWLASERRKYLTVLSAALLALEILADDFAGWGTAFPDEATRAQEILVPRMERLRPSWLEFYFPHGPNVTPEFLRAFGPSKNLHAQPQK